MMVNIVSPLRVTIRWAMRKRNGQPHNNEVVVHFTCPKCKRVHRVRELFEGPPVFAVPHYHRNRCGAFSVAMPWFKFTDRAQQQHQEDGRTLAAEKSC